MFRRKSEAAMAWRRGQTYSQDLRDRVLAADALTARQAAERFGVSVSYVVKARQRLVRTGAPTPRPQKPPTARKLSPVLGALQERVARAPDATLAEHREWLAEAHGVVAGVTTVWKTLTRLKLTRKKSRSGRPSRADPTSPKPDGNGSPGNPIWMWGGWSSSMRPGPRRT
jgi:transposase